ncbi:MAG: hypothetical protein QOG43_467 [Actinomycetota bacterium]|jgi:hypothetical protein|nr:hypothetical protein [Actinomycetota bacterium]
MSLIKLLPAWLHAIADYAVGVLLVAIALTVDMSTKATVAGVVVGATVLAVSLLTRYPLGVVKVLPFRIHSIGDYAAAILLFVAPFALGFNDTDSGVTAFYIAAGIAVLAVSLITNYQYGPQAIPTTDWSGSAPRTAPAPVSAYTPWRPEIVRQPGR